MGTEINLAGFRINEIQGLLLPWLQTVDLHPDIDAYDENGDGLMNLESDVAAVEFELDIEEQVQIVPHVADVPLTEDGGDGECFLPNAFSVPGILHVVNNSLKELSTKLRYFDQFFSQLQSLESLWKAGRLTRFINFCVRPNAPPEVAALFLRRKLGSLYLARWNEVCRFCGRLKDLLPYLRGLWDERAFMSDVQEKDTATFQPADVTAVLADSLFMAYFDMVLGLSTTLEQLGSWCESCPCHEDLIPTVEAPGHALFSRKRKRYTSMSKLFGCKVGDGSDSFTCPMRGKRFPELVAYGMQKVLDANHQNAQMHLLIGHRKFLSPEQWCVLVSDFEQGKHSIELEMSIKLDYTQRLPYKLAVLGLADVGCARRKMLEIVEFWDGQTDFLHKQHHPLSQRILSQDSIVRKEVDRFIEGEALCNLPSLEHLAGCFRLVQVSERYLEASHSILKRKVAPNSAGPVISLSRRLWRLAMDIEIDPNTLMQVADLYEVARDVKSLPARLGLAGHPDLRVTANKKKWGIVKVMNRILYRCDVPGQYLDVSEPRKFDDSYQNNRKKLRQAIADRVCNRGKVPVGYEAIRLSALQQHMLALSEDNAEGIFCLQVPYRSLPDVLQDLPTAMRTVKISLQEISLMPDVQQAGPGLGFDNEEYAESYAATEDGGNPNPVVQIFFRIVHTKPSSRRTISLAPGAGIGSRLHAQDVAVHIYETVSQPGRELQTWLECCPKSGQLSQVSVLRDFSKWFSFEELSDCLLWGTFTKAHESMYQLDKHRVAESSMSVPSDSILFSLQCDQVLTRLVSAKALRIPVDDVLIVDIVSFDKLLEANLVSKSDGFFEATTVLLSCLKLVRQMEPLKSVAASFETIAPTTHQLLQQLEEQGFQWKQLEQKEALMYEVGKTKIWGTRGQEVFPEMLQCLLSASDLEKQFGIKQIPCGRSRRVYVDLLQGVLPPVVQNMPQLVPDVAVAPRQRKKSAPMALMDLGAAVDGQVDSMAINVDCDNDDDKAVHDRSIACVDSIHDVDVDVGQEEDILRLLELVGEPEANHDEIAVPDAVSDRAESSHQHAEDGAGAPAQADSVQSQAMKAPPPVDLSAPANPGPDPSPEQPNVNNFSWGAFRFTFKKTGKQMAVQATCPFHAKNNSTGCKKSLNINPFTQARLDEQVLLLKHWCNQATKFSFQRDHLNCPLQHGSVPDSSVVEAQCIPRASKPEDVITDVAQDAAANATQSRPKAKAQSKSAAVKNQKVPRPKGAAAGAASSSNQLPGNKPKGDSSSSSSSDTSGSGSDSSDSSQSGSSSS